VRAAIGLAYYPGTDDLFVTMNQRDDLGEATPGDWLAVIAPGDDWGFPDCYGQESEACVGTPAPIAELAPHAALGGLAIVTGELGDTVGTAAIVAAWAGGDVQLVTLERSGDSYVGEPATFLTGLENPMPVALADGGVLVGDWTTGTVYLVSA
jgi:glucose/arabinose dehydrogenase